MAKRSPAIHIIPCLDWQREGSQAFELSRLGLVRRLDAVLDRMADRDPQTLMLGGQSVLLDDYLALRPARAGQVAELMADGRLHVGPWYVQTEPFLASPEALVRNLLVSMQAAEPTPARLHAAYTPDALALVGQLPQILADFGIDAVVTRQGPGAEPVELWWDAPDGSRVMLVNLCRGDVENTGELNGQALQPIGVLWDSVRASSYTGIVPLFVDSGQPVRSLEPAARPAAVDAGPPDADIVVSSLPAYLDSALAANDYYQQVTGERHLGSAETCCGGALSSRIWQKQRNHAGQILLERWAEPFSAWAAFAAVEHIPFTDQPELIEYAWRLLLQTHSPDAIRGTGVDAVHREVDARLDRVMQVAGALAGENLRILARSIDTSRLPGGEGAAHVVVVNGSGTSHTDVVEVELPPEQSQGPYEVLDEAGQVAPCEVLLEVEEHQAVAGNLRTLLHFTAEDVPAYGYRAYTLRPATSGEAFQYVEDDGTEIENEYLRVVVSPDDGTLTVTDKHTGHVFAGLNRFADGGDGGDVRAYQPPVRDVIIDFPTNTPVRAERLIGPVTRTLNVFQIFRLPASLSPDRRSRLPLTRQFVPVSVMTTVRLARSVPRADVEVIVTNSARDHRLRVHFPTGLQHVEEAWFDGHYEVVRRNVSDPPMEQPQRAFVTVLGESAGLTVANRGLPAAAVVHGGSQGAEIALTLLRCVGWRGDEAVPEAQGLGEHTFTYSIIPHGPDPLPAWEQAWAFQAPLRAEYAAINGAGTLPVAASLAAVDNPHFVLTAIKQTTDGRHLLVRGYNLSSEMQPVALRLGLPFHSVTFARLDESAMNAAPDVGGDGVCHFEAAPHKIVSLRFAVD